jgi:hypothetical protein
VRVKIKICALRAPCPLRGPFLFEKKAPAYLTIVPSYGSIEVSEQSDKTKGMEVTKIKLPVAAQNLIAYWAINRLTDEMYRKKDHILYTDNEPTDELEALREFIQALEMTADSFASNVRTSADNKDAQEMLEKFSRLI